MKKTILALLSLLIVSMFLVSCAPQDGSNGALAGEAVGGTNRPKCIFNNVCGKPQLAYEKLIYLNVDLPVLMGSTFVSFNGYMGDKAEIVYNHIIIGEKVIGSDNNIETASWNKNNGEVLNVKLCEYFTIPIQGFPTDAIGPETFRIVGVDTVSGVIALEFLG